MARDKSPKKDRNLSDAAPAHRPFQALEALRSRLPPGPVAEPESPEAERGASGPADQRTVWVRLERKGRGGKTVTRVQGLPGPQLEGLSRDLRKSLGVGSSLEGEDVILQGDLRERARAWLEGQGYAARVGN